MCGCQLALHLLMHAITIEAVFVGPTCRISTYPHFDLSTVILSMHKVIMSDNQLQLAKKTTIFFQKKNLGNLGNCRS